MIKQCTKCKKRKIIKYFSHTKTNPDGFHSTCKECCKVVQKKWRIKNKEKVKKDKQIYYQQNKEKCNEESKKWYHTNLERAREQSRKRARKSYQKHRERYLTRAKKWRKENPEKMKLAKKRWNEANREHNKIMSQKWNKKNKKKVRTGENNRYKNNIKFKLLKNTRSYIHQKLKRKLSGKLKQPKFTFLPYTINELMQHLENQFKHGMTWDNYGKWQMDHKIPNFKFNYKSTNDEEFQKCWALNNLQPLWAEENRKKNKH